MMATSMKMATEVEVQNDFNRYLQYAIDNGEVIILRNGKPVARIVSEDTAAHYLTDSLVGVLQHNYSEADAKDARVSGYSDME